MDAKASEVQLNCEVKPHFQYLYPCPEDHGPCLLVQHDPQVNGITPCMEGHLRTWREKGSPQTHPDSDNHGSLLLSKDHGESAKLSPYSVVVTILGAS